MSSGSTCIDKSLDQYRLNNDVCGTSVTWTNIWNPLLSYTVVTRGSMDSYAGSLLVRYEWMPRALSGDVVHLDTPPHENSRRTCRSRRRARESQDTISVITDVQLLRVSQQITESTFPFIWPFSRIHCLADAVRMVELRVGWNRSAAILFRWRKRELPCS